MPQAKIIRQRDGAYIRDRQGAYITMRAVPELAKRRAVMFGERAQASTLLEGEARGGRVLGDGRRGGKLLS